MSDLSHISAASRYSPEQLALGEKIYQLFSHQQSGHLLPECYNEIGSPLWSYFEKIQSNPRLKYAYDVAVLGAQMVEMNVGAFVQLVLEDPNLDKDNLIVVEKGGGDAVATMMKTLVILRALREAGINVALYANLEGSEFFREQNRAILKREMPGLLVNELDADFHNDDPDLSYMDFKDEGQPRLLLEFGSPRSNVATTSQNELPTRTLEQYFNNDARLCKGGLLIMDCDSTQDKDTNEGMYTHPVHAQVGHSLLVHAQRQGVIMGDFEPMWFFYQPQWEAARSLLKHSLISAATQNFGVLRQDARFHQVITPESSAYTHSHSFKWKPQVLRDAAYNSHGAFEQKAFFPMEKGGVERVNGYAFKPH
jgi:hypothetical protein